MNTGAQSTIISWKFLHRVSKHLQERGLPRPKLELPHAKLYGKDRKSDGTEIIVTTRVRLTLEADGRTVCVPVFVQPHSEQECLLGTSATRALGLTFLDSKNEPLLEQS